MTPEQALAWVIGLAVALGLAWLLVRLVVGPVLSAADKPPQAALIVVLAILTLLAMFGALVTDSDSAWAVAATGVGAIAGSLQSLFGAPSVSLRPGSDEDGGGNDG